MNSKTRQDAIKRLAGYKSTGMVFQYAKSGRWNFATEGSPVYNDVLDSMNSKGQAVINPGYMGGIKVEKVEIFTAVPKDL